MRWNKADLPHKGWTEIGMEDLGEGLEGEEIEYEQCEMCGNEKIRYVHIMKHPEVHGELHVGCICASKMTDDYVNPEARENPAQPPFFSSYSPSKSSPFSPTQSINS